jgi:hypothetical protein
MAEVDNHQEMMMVIMDSHIEKTKTSLQRTEGTNLETNRVRIIRKPLLNKLQSRLSEDQRLAVAS